MLPIFKQIENTFWTNNWNVIIDKKNWHSSVYFVYLKTTFLLNHSNSRKPIGGIIFPSFLNAFQSSWLFSKNSEQKFSLLIGREGAGDDDVSSRMNLESGRSLSKVTKISGIRTGSVIAKVIQSQRKFCFIRLSNVIDRET